MQRVHLVVAGKVQGVYFRAGTLEEARRLGGITGWVRNNTDGGVEILAEGAQAQLEALHVWCQRGPRAARVDHIDATWSAATGEFTTFDISFDAMDDPFGPQGER